MMSSTTPIAALLAAALLTGCAYSAISLRSTNSPSMPGGNPPPGSSYSYAAVHADVSPGTFFGALFFGYLLGAFRDDGRGWREGMSGRESSAWRKPPELAEGRAIAERDCSQPMERPYANLRCK
jgi:hypothetical protein